MLDRNSAWDVIDTYTRADMLRDGGLIAADPTLLRHLGIRYPVAFTAAVHEDCIDWTSDDNGRQDLNESATGREMDILVALRAAISREPNTDMVRFTVARVPRDGISQQPERVVLYAVVGPGDNYEPVITVLAALDEL